MKINGQTSRFYNRTRVSKSIPRRLIKEGKLHLLPFYYIVLTSYLAEEATKNSGSHLLADHIYKGKPQGKFFIGRFIDYILLSLPSARSFRNRYLFSKKEILSAIKELSHSKNHIRVLSVPCGIPRDLIEIGITIKENGLVKNKVVTFMGLDLDPQALLDAKKEAKKYNIEQYFQFIQGDALTTTYYPKNIDIIVSTGFGEFLNDDELLRFYKIIYKTLNPNGLFYTSALDKHRLSDYLLRELGEIYTNYRTLPHIQSIISKVGFKSWNIYSDSNKLQTIVVARK